ncbi:hypothetical protein KJ596_04810 [Patescibacteria group bacterium]|nr:hypothetical protein [Patescibacteria group bacterium]MBU1868470.1 hypothetical protein [Patescibacteria group bacterium]
MSKTREHLANKLLDFILPKFCVHCNKFGYYLCQNCYNKIEFISQQLCPICYRPAIDGLTHPGCLTILAIDGIISATKYCNITRSLIKKLKYHPSSRQVFEEIDLIIKRYFIDTDLTFPTNSTLVPIPLHTQKLKKRGFNQAELIANSLSNLWELPVIPDLFTRTRQGIDQTSLPRKQRLKNVRSLYRINPRKKSLVNDNNFILVDDVTTTGATLKKCANLLKRNHAAKVWGITLARD